MRGIFCTSCGDKQSVPEDSDSFVCSNCGCAYQINADGELLTVTLKASQNVQKTSWLKKGDSEIRSLFSNPKTPASEESKTEQSKPGKLSNALLVVLSTAVVISLVFLSFIVIREIQSKRSAPPPTSNLSNLPKYDPDLYQTATKTAIPSWTPTATKTITPSSTPIFGSVKSLTLNLRAGPGIGYRILKILQMEEIITLIARNDLNNWIMIETADGDLGWVSAFLVDHDYELSQLRVDYEIFTIPVTGTSQTVTSTLTTTGTAEPTSTLAPTLTQTPVFTQTPAVPYTATPHLFPTPSEGKWCEKNSVREICVHKIEFFIDTVNDGSEPADTLYIIMDISVQNLASFDIVVDPIDFTLVLKDGSFSFFFNNPGGVFEDIDELEFTSIAPGVSLQGVLLFSVPEDALLKSLTYQGYLYESVISIDFTDES